MNILTNRLRASITIGLVGAVLTVFTFTSFAALEGGSAYPGLQAPTGTITKVKRNGYMNGAEAKEGATVLDGSLFRTQIGSRIIIDISSLGGVDYGESTESVLTLTDKSILASLNRCGFIRLILKSGITGTVKIISMHDVGLFSERKEVDVKVESGQVTVKRLQNKEDVMSKGDHDEFDDAIEVTATGEAVFNVYCREDHYLGLFFLPALGALFIPGDDEIIPPPVLSPITP